MPQTEPEPKRSFPWAIAAAFILFAVLSVFDFPKPMFDDLFYNGAALNMAGGGDYSNPLLIRQNFPSHYFFVYPPFHPYAVYGWISLFGVSAASLLAFQNAMFFIMAAATIFILRRFRAAEFLSWLVPLGVTSVFLKLGLRPEAFAVAMTMAGYATFLYGQSKKLWLWFAYFLMCVGTMAAPRTAFFGAAFILVSSWQYLGYATAIYSKRVQFCVTAALALAAALALFALLIHFRVEEFYQTFHLHSSRLQRGKLSLLNDFMIELGAKSWPFLLLTVVLSCLAMRKPLGEAERVCFGLAGMFLLAGFMGALGRGSSWYLNVMLFLLAAVLLKRLSPPKAICVNLALVLVLLGANSSNAVQMLALVTGKSHGDPPENRDACLSLQSTKEHPVLVDGYVARYVFDYKLPAGFIDYEFAAPFPGIVATDAKLRPEDIFLLGPSKTELLNTAIHSDYRIETWKFLGINNWAEFVHPHQVYIIPARDCIEILARSSAK